MKNILFSVTENGTVKVNFTSTPSKQEVEKLSRLLKEFGSTGYIVRSGNKFSLVRMGKLNPVTRQRERKSEPIIFGTTYRIKKDTPTKDKNKQNMLVSLDSLSHNVVAK